MGEFTYVNESNRSLENTSISCLSTKRSFKYLCHGKSLLFEEAGLCSVSWSRETLKQAHGVILLWQGRNPGELSCLLFRHLLPLHRVS